MDTYQPIYDAVRSKISGCDVGSAIDRAITDMNLGHYVFMAMETVKMAAAEHERPSSVMRPKVFVDGSQWCALYGDNLQDGVAGFGDSPSLAMYDFDKNWFKKLETPNDQ